MIIHNGYIRPRIKAEGGQSAIDPRTGYPRKAVITPLYGDPVPCHYYPTAFNAQARVQGEAITRQSYEILIELQQRFDSEQIILSDISGRVVGEFSVMETVHMRAVRQTKLLV